MSKSEAKLYKVIDQAEKTKSGGYCFSRIVNIEDKNDNDWIATYHLKKVDKNKYETFG